MLEMSSGFEPERPLLQRLLLKYDAASAAFSSNVTEQRVTRGLVQAKMVKAKGGQEIPIPEVNDVPDHIIEYLPTFRPPNTYIRGRGKAWIPSFCPLLSPVADTHFLPHLRRALQSKANLTIAQQS